MDRVNFISFRFASCRAVYIIHIFRKVEIFKRSFCQIVIENKSIYHKRELYICIAENDLRLTCIILLAHYALLMMSVVKKVRI